MAGRTPTQPVPEGVLICGDMAGRCICHEPKGHVEAGDRIHVCDVSRCKGSWIGEHGQGTFSIVSLPFPQDGVEPEPWPWEG